ncbi:glycosyltransferase [uncultured Treponema sp.]|uniref:glycosyltransferase family 8 protein n=1 Tax=uncultured Treponema sp. TaxID=162155 RepID=UPI002639B878|nr:glycosyltransferase [uncultured Treponema sp.]
MNIVYTCQENYANIAGISIFSLLKTNLNEYIHIYFLDSGLSENSKNRMRNLCKSHGKSYIDFFDVSLLLKKYSDKLTAFQNNYATYAKLFTEMLLPKNINDCLYIDADTIILSSLSEIFNNKDKFTLSMGYDVVHKNHKKNISMKVSEPYFNAGVIFMNLKKWRENNYSEKILKFISEKNSFIYGDQDIFNLVFRNDIGKLDFKNNVITQFFFFKKLWLIRLLYKLNDNNFYNKSEFNFSKINIIHFTYFPFILRPWFLGSNHPYVNYYYNMINESPYKKDFKIVKFKQPRRRKLIQILNRNLIVVTIVGFMSKIFYGNKKSKSLFLEALK